MFVVLRPQHFWMHLRNQHKEENPAQCNPKHQTGPYPQWEPGSLSWRTRSTTLFLELFLSYMLEKDRLDAEESELPLLSAFSQQLHTRELHSVTFDMLTTLKRRQKDRKRSVQLPVFHAGHCSLLVTPPSSIGPVQSDTHATGKLGLFALRRHATPNLQRG